jgi:hypothetical protein
MAPPAAPEPAGVRCPRCGYDLRGLVAAWRETCPLEGRCGECGLDFAWAEIFSALAQAPRWCVEFAPGMRVLPAALFTAAMSLAPARFWKSMRMSFPLRPRRLALYVIVLAAACYACFAMAHASIVVEYAGRRGVTWGAPGPGKGTVWLHAALLPFSDRAVHQITVGPPGAGVLRLSPRMFLVYWPVGIHFTAAAVPAVIAGPLVLAALVATRRQANVRAVHLVRMTAYSAVWLAAVWTIGSVMHVASWKGMWLARSAAVERVQAIAMVLWMLLLWHAAIRHYLRLRHAWATAIAATVTGVLGGMIALLAINRGLALGFLQTFGLPE